MKKKFHRTAIAPVAALLFFLTSCGTLWTVQSQYEGVDPLLATNQFQAIQQQIEQKRRTHYPRKDRALYYLELGLLQHYSGQYRASNTSLEQAEQAMDAAFVKSLTRAGASLLLNDNLLEYAGEDYEQVYLNVFKALNFLALNEFDPAFVEIRRIDEKLKVLESRYWKVAQRWDEATELEQPFTVGKNRFRNSALGRWLSLLVYRAEGRADEAAIDLKKIERARALAPQLYNFQAPDLSDALSAPRAGRVNVSFLGLTGPAPLKRADTLWIHTQLDHIVIANSSDRWQLKGIQPIPWPGIEAGYTFQFQLPQLVKRSSKVGSIRLRIDGRSGPALQTIESLENAAQAAFEIQRPLTYLKTIARAVSKGLAAAQAQQAAKEKWGELSGLFAGLVAGSGVAITEHADLRMARFFPAQAHIAEVQLPPGEHRIAFEYYSANGSLLYRDERHLTVANKPLHLVESVYLN